MRAACILFGLIPFIHSVVAQGITKPTAVTVSQPTASSLDIKAESRYNTGNYKFFLKEGKSAEIVATCGVAIGICRVGGLKINTFYQISARVCPNNDNDCSEPTAAAEIHKTLPGVLINIHMTERNDSSLSFAWENPPGVQSITITAMRNGEHNRTVIFTRPNILSYCTLVEMSSAAQYKIVSEVCYSPPSGAGPLQCLVGPILLVSTLPTAPSDISFQYVTMVSAIVVIVAPIENGYTLLTYEVTSHRFDDPNKRNCSSRCSGSCRTMCTLTNLSFSSEYLTEVRGCMMENQNSVCGAWSEIAKFSTSDQFLSLSMFFILIYLTVLILTLMIIGFVFVYLSQKPKEKTKKGVKEN